MSHQNDVIFQSYVSSTIGIDTQNVVKGQPEDTEYVDLTRSIALTKDVDLPKPHRSMLSRLGGGEPHPDIIARLIAKFPNNKTHDIMRKAWKQQHISDIQAHNTEVCRPTKAPVEAVFQARATR